MWSTLQLILKVTYFLCYHFPHMLLSICHYSISTHYYKQMEQDDKELAKGGFAEPKMLEQQQKIEQNTAVASEFRKEYEQFFKNETFTEETMKEAIGRLKEEGIIYDPSHFQRETNIQIKNSTNNHRIVTLRVAFGYYTMDMLVLNQQKMSPAHSCKSTSTARNVEIFFARDINEAIKCYEIKGTDMPFKIFTKALKECCLLKIASALRVGPIYTNFSGFNLIFYSNCVQFSMELCADTKKVSEQITNKHFSALKTKLKLLHLMGIVHVDIKPDNIMFSRGRKDLIFIDFGFSKAIEEPLGFKSSTLFTGTFEYCSPQMRNLLANESSNLIDLYYNDVYSLIPSIAELASIKVQLSLYMGGGDSDDWIEDLYENTVKKNYLQYYRILKVKRQIYLSNKSIVEDFQLKSILIKHRKAFLSFLSELPYCYFTVELYGFLVSQFRSAEERKDYLTSLQSRKERIFKRKVEEQTQNIFISKLAIDIKQTLMTFSQWNSVITYVLAENPKVYLLDPDRISKMTRNQLYDLYLKTVDLRSNFSSFAQKKEVSISLLEIVGAKDRLTAEARSEFPELEAGLLWVLNFILEKGGENVDRMVPVALINLVIIESLSPSQLSSIMKKVVSLECPLLQRGILLFRCCQIQHWMNFKVVSKYSSLQFQISIANMIKTEMKALINTKYHNLFIIMKDALIANEIINLSAQDYDQYLISYLQILECDSEFIQELLTLAVYEHQRKENKNQIKRLFNPLMRLYLIDNKFYNKHKIRTVHLLISQQLGSSPILKDINSLIIGCLQDINIISKTKLFYSEQSSLFFRLELSKRINLLITVCDDSQGRYQQDILERLIDVLVELFFQSKRTEDDIMMTLICFRKIFNIQYLDCIPFPTEKDTNFVNFYQLILTIFKLFCRLYPMQGPEVCHFPEVLKKAQEYWETIQCNFCRAMTYQIICHLNIIIFQTQDNSQGVLQICAKSLERLRTDRKCEPWRYHHIVMYVRRTIMEVRNQVIHQKHPWRRFTDIVYRTIVDEELFSCIFQYDTITGKEIYQFINSRIIELQGYYPTLYLAFQHRLLSFLENYPSTAFLTAYHSSLNSQSVLLKPYALLIMQEYFKTSPKLGTHSAILIAHLFHLLPINSALLYRSAVVLCRSADFSVGFTKFFSLQQLFLNESAFLTLLPIPRKRRRKVFANSRYFVYSHNFKQFLKLINLSSRLKKSTTLQLTMIKSKLKLFFQSISKRK